MSRGRRGSTVASMHPAQRIASVPRRPTQLDVAVVVALLAWALATFSVGLHVASLRRAVLAGLVTIAAMSVALMSGAWSGDPQPGDLVFLLFFVGGTWILGRMVRHRAAQADTAASARA